MFGLGGLLGVAGGLLGFGSAARGQNKEQKRQLGLIAEQNDMLDVQLTNENKSYRDALRKRGSGMATGDFSSRLLQARQYTGF